MVPHTLREAYADGGPFARYREVVDDWAAFQRGLEAPLAPHVTANRLRIASRDLQRLLEGQGLPAESVGWYPGGFRLPHGSNPGLRWEYRAGLYQVQGEASLLPVRLLDARPGDFVLDLCAAPGGKTAQLAMALGNRGTVIANDRDSRRLPAVRDVVKRLGLLNVTATNLDGCKLPVRAGPFDKVLVDAPCSAEGTARKADSAHAVSPAGFRGHLARTQRALLRRALRLCRPGGRVVYATCTFAPEENEAVVDAVLREAGGDARVLPPPDLAGLWSASGLTAWRGARFHPDLAHAVRLWPHRSRTGGFFAVVLERCGMPDPAHEDMPSELPTEPGPASDVDALIGRVRDRFALPPGSFGGLRFFRKGGHGHALAADHRIPGRLEPVFSGLPLARLDGSAPKISTAAVLAFLRSARANAVDLDAPQLDAFHRRRRLTLTNGQRAAVDGDGYVVLRRAGHVVGLGYLRARDEVESLFPKAWAAQPDG